jgi:hypothetical protein
MFDEKCFDLAREFLCDEDDVIDTEANRAELAQTIQDTIEDFIEQKKNPVTFALKD